MYWLEISKLLHVETVKHYEAIKIPSTKPVQWCRRRQRRRTRPGLLSVVFMSECCFSCNLRMDSMEFEWFWRVFVLFAKLKIELLFSAFHIIYHVVLVWFYQCSLISRTKPLYFRNKGKLTSVFSNENSMYEFDTHVVHCTRHFYLFKCGWMIIICVIY